MENFEKLYKEALERAKKLHNSLVEKGTLTTSKGIESIFPELRESEDERIRQELIETIRWIKKGRFPTAVQIQKSSSWIAWLEKQGEQKPTDNVEPKFKVGDWIVTPDNETKQIEEVTFGNYWFTDKTLYNIIDVDNKGHLWTIQDAKDGDVFANEDMVVIFKCFEEPSYRQHIIAHIGLDTCGRIQVTNEYWILGLNCAKPATKEQRDLLFSKMKEAGYEWYSEKKELKKIEQNHAWSEGDEMMLECVLDKIGEQGSGEIDKEWLKSLKNRVQLQPKQEWSEKDEKMLQFAIDSFQFCVDHKQFPYVYNTETHENVLNWLKSLKPQPN